MSVGFEFRPELSLCTGVYLMWGNQASSEECELCKAARFYLAKSPCSPLLPPDMQLQYQETCYPAIHNSPFMSCHVRTRSGSVWFRSFLSVLAALPLMVTWGSCSSSLRWLVLNSCSARCYVREAVFLPACWCLLARGKCLLSSLVGFFKMLHTKVWVIVLSLSLKANFWITEENNIACIPCMPAHPAI